MPEIVCPAGEPVAETSQGRACRCHIERNTLSIRSDPRTLIGRCCDQYEFCATWRAEKERIWEYQRKAIVDQD